MDVFVDATEELSDWIPKFSLREILKAQMEVPLKVPPFVLEIKRGRLETFLSLLAV